MAEILPSILSADFARLGEQLGVLEQAGCRMVHVDVMDGHFVPNITLGPPVVASLRKATRMTLDVHLMISDPDRYAPLFVEAGADQVSVHQETCPHLDRTVRMIQGLGARAGVVVNPATAVDTLDEVLGFVDFVLIMSVNPGFGGQKFIMRQLQKIRALRARIDALDKQIDLEVDGGINFETAKLAMLAGADVLVAGTATFTGGPAAYAENIRRLRLTA